ncbi:GNAT family N-acetyltransferase [Vibrio sp. 10N.261.55.A7]|uniref:GNAT family N-acetyltransferase n=1 Tax=Vibrio sp. 10N.261.55.A7 TaxID=1880851 RepID=UPI000C866C9C|nr:GNAT family N-acetyltransferase [Vibrio sp. 10N.261.55.A7]PMJ89295.1 GNAT family N-acetyltransferase [Vibrio sp. 10N.261.55.A7]
MSRIQWLCLPFNQLTTLQLYQLLKLRVDVFVVEQNCPYPELDNKDIQDDVYHLLGYSKQDLVACARLLPVGISYSEVSIGRIATSEMARGNGLGNNLLSEALTQTQSLWPDQSITIGAQQHLFRFYQAHGFEQISEMYLEDGIPHIDMTLIK